MHSFSALLLGLNFPLAQIECEKKFDARYDRGAPLFVSDTTPQFWSLRPPPRTDLLWRKIKLLLIPDKDYHGLGTGRESNTQTNGRFPTMWAKEPCHSGAT